jgi:BirA family biotin operon repressor/biotin-[acetyl-CoA-carboxylase] ligase
VHRDQSVANTVEDKILDVFRSNRSKHISGEEISELLGISRAAVWKHVRSLREKGYNIEAQPHLGYRLMTIPDKMVPQEISWNLQTICMGKRIFSYEETDSTNDVACNLAMNGACEGTVVFAEYQTRGRGRMGREWLSPRGKNILMSVILKPDILPSEAPKVTLVSAVAVAAAIGSVGHVQPLIKWPNDIQINGKKVAGILTEMNAETDSIKFVILGIGVNVNAPAGNLPAGSTSLVEELNQNVSRIELAREILRQLDLHYLSFRKGEFNKIISTWTKMSAIGGKRVRVTCHNRKIEGYPVGVDSDGALVVRTDSGFTERILTGDVVMVR